MKLLISTKRRTIFQYRWGEHGAAPAIEVGSVRFFRYRNGEHKDLRVGRVRIFFLSSTFVGLGPWDFKKHEDGEWRRKHQ